MRQLAEEKIDGGCAGTESVDTSHSIAGFSGSPVRFLAANL
jgi:hypothetical protein